MRPEPHGRRDAAEPRRRDRRQRGEPAVAAAPGRDARRRARRCRIAGKREIRLEEEIVLGAMPGERPPFVADRAPRRLASRSAKRPRRRRAVRRASAPRRGRRDMSAPAAMLIAAPPAGVGARAAERRDDRAADAEPRRGDPVERDRLDDERHRRRGRRAGQAEAPGSA